MYKSVKGDIYEWSRSKLINLKSKVQTPEKAYLCLLYSSLVWNTVMVYMDSFWHPTADSASAVFLFFVISVFKPNAKASKITL